MVQITDNWGYCADGIYGDEASGCVEENDESYTKFNGYLIILPENSEDQTFIDKSIKICYIILLNNHI